jgi:hypothetical protein
MFGAALVFEAGPLPDRASPLMHQSHVVSVVWVMSGGLPVFGIAGLANIEKRSLPHEFAARTVDQSWSRSPSTANQPCAMRPGPVDPLRSAYARTFT